MASPSYKHGFNAVDVNDDGVIDREEWKAYMYKQNKIPLMRQVCLALGIEVWREDAADRSWTRCYPRAPIGTPKRMNLGY